MNLPTQGSVEYHDHICIRWKVGSDMNFVNCHSQSVLFRKSQLTLRLVKPTAMPLLVMQMKSEPNLEGIYEVENFILDKKNTKFHRKKQYLSFSTPFFTETWSINRQLIHSNMSELAANDVLHFVCVINYSPDRCLGKQLNVIESTDSSLEKLSVDVSNFYKSSEHSDICLKCGDSRIPAHKFILSARSDVFAAMFKSDMIECQKGVIDIQDIELPILDLLIKYIYSGKMDPIAADTAIKLYRAADKYAVLSLKKKCSLVMVKELSAENACEILVLSDSHADENLKNHVHSYLRRNEKFIISDEWKTFSKVHPELAVEAYDFYVRGMIQDAFKSPHRAYC